MIAKVLLRACNRPTSTPTTIPNSNACWHINRIIKQVRNRIIFTPNLSSALLPNWFWLQLQDNSDKFWHPRFTYDEAETKPFDHAATYNSRWSSAQKQHGTRQHMGNKNQSWHYFHASGVRREAKVCPNVTAWRLPSCVLLDGLIYGFDIVPQYLPLQM